MLIVTSYYYSVTDPIGQRALRLKTVFIGLLLSAAGPASVSLNGLFSEASRSSFIKEIL